MTDERPDELADDAAPLTPEEEAAVRGLLAVLPDPELPADVEARIVAAARASLPGSGEPTDIRGDADEDPLGVAAPAAGGGARSGSRHATSGSNRWRQPWLLQSAAVLVVLALIGGVVVGLIASRGDDSGQPLVLAQETAGPVTVSGRDYEAATLAGQVRGLIVTPAAVSATPSGGEPADSAASGGEGEADSGVAGDMPVGGFTAGDVPSSSSAKSSSSDATAAGGGGGSLPGGSGEKKSKKQKAQEARERAAAKAYAAAVAAVSTLVTDATLRQSCIDRLASTPGALPVAVDAGVYEGRPAAIFVLPDETDPAKVAAWVVGPTCSDTDVPFPYRYERVDRP